MHKIIKKVIEKMKRSKNPEKFLDASEKEVVGNAIKKAEKGTSAEIKLVIVRHCWGDIKDKAAKIFRKNSLDNTKERNCVMIMLVLTNREFLIYGDEGIHKHVGQNFWDDTKNTMLEYFKNDEFGKGIACGIESIGEKLHNFYPYRKDDINEISDEITVEE